MKFYTGVFSFVLIILFQINTFSQIPNAGFENWTNSDPDGWFTFDFLGFSNAVTQSTEAHSGSSAARLEIVSTIEGSIPPYLFSYFPITERYGSLTGYYKFFPQTEDDAFNVVVDMFIGTNIIGAGGFSTNSATSSYTQFVVPIDYFSEGTPDTAYITVVVGDTSLGTYALIDDLAFGGSVDVQLEAPNPSSYNMLQNYPNPFNPSTKINFSITEQSYVELIIYDLLGREIERLVSDNYSAGEYSVDFNADNLPNGIYIAKMNAGKYSKAIKMTLLK